MFDDLMRSIDQEILNNMFRSATSLSAFEKLFAQLPRELFSGSADGMPQEEPHSEPQQEEVPDIHISFRRETPKVGRNEPCPCGSGKKYKNCCGR